MIDDGSVLDKIQIHKNEKRKTKKRKLALSALSYSFRHVPNMLPTEHYKPGKKSTEELPYFTIVPIFIFMTYL